MKERSWWRVMGALSGLGLALSFAAVSASCGDDDTNERPVGPCTVGSPDRCDEGEVCQPVEGAEPACLPAYTIRGVVLDLVDSTPVEGAVVVAVNAAGLGASRRVVTEFDGAYSLVVPVTHGADGSPQPTPVTLFAQAPRHATYPDAPRRPTVLDVTTAPSARVLESPDTRIFLQRDPVAPTEQAGEVEGRLEGDLAAGALVACGGKVAMADLDGRFVLFDVPAGSQKLEVFRRGAAFPLDVVDVPNRERLYDVTVRQSSSLGATLTATFTESGATGGADIALALASTFDAASGRGFVPPSLVYPAAGPSVVLDGVPRGEYVILSLANDGLTLDPDPLAMQPKRFTVAADAALDPIPLVPAVALESPGASVNPLVGATAFSFRVVDGADTYALELFDPAGTRTWETTASPTPDAAGIATVAYAGTELVRGVVYQIRVTALAAGQPIAVSEPMSGGFFVPAQ